MKKIFLVFGIASFSSASAQQKDVFDIERHLQKLTTEKKKPEVSLQRQPVFEFRQLPPILLSTLPNGDRVMTLPGYNMPCVVPGNTYLYSTPNLTATSQPLLPGTYKGNHPGAIPNPADNNIQFR